MKRRKPTRKDLLVVIARLQDAIGEARMYYEDDRNPNGLEQGRAVLTRAHDLCIDASSYDPPKSKLRGPWAT